MMTSATGAARDVGRAEQLSGVARPDSTAARPSTDFEFRATADHDALARLLSHSRGDSLLYALQVATREEQLELGKEEVQCKKQELEQLFAKIEKAMREAQEAAEDRGFFASLSEDLGAVAKVAAVVAAAASVVATGGASVVVILALAGTLISSCSGELAKLAGGSELAEKIFCYGGAGLSLVAGGIGAYQALTSSTGAVANAAGQSGVQAVSKGLCTAEKYVQAGVTGGQALAGVARDSSAVEELAARADEKEFRSERDVTFQRMESVIEFLKEVQQSFNNQSKILIQIMENRASATMATARGVRA